MSLVQMDGNIMTVLEGAQEAEDVATILIQVSFPKRFSVTAQTTITVVEFVGLVASSTFWPPQAVYSPNDVTELRQFGCSGVFQRLEARATGSLSDGTVISSYDFYKNVQFVSTFPEVSELSSSPCWSGMCRGLVASTFGTTDIVGTFATFNSSITVNVIDDPIVIVDLQFVGDIGTDTNLNGVVDTTHGTATAVSFSDATTNTLANSGQLTSGWLPPSSLLNFSPALPSVFSVDFEGVLELYNNYYSTVRVSAVDTCGYGQNATIDVYANLEPEVYDMDLGNRYGAPFGTATTGETFP